MPTVLVTGATGFVGTGIVRALAARGDRVVVLSRDAERARRALPEAKEARAPAPDGAVSLDGVDAIVHLAGETVAGRWTAKKKDAIEKSRVEGTARLVRSIAAASARPRVLVSASAIGFYGDRGEEELDESRGPGDDFLARVCIGWEREALAAKELGVRVVPVRIGLVMGAGGGALESMRPAFAAGLGGALGSGAQWWPWVALDDLVRLFLWALDTERVDAAINGVAPEPVRQRDFARTLGRVLHRPTFLPAPAFALRVVLGEFSAELLASRRVVPKRALELGFEFASPDLEPTLRASTA